MMPRILCSFLLLTFAPVDIGEIRSGDYLALYARIIGCDSKHHLVDYAKVLESGKAEFLSGASVAASSMTPDRIADYLADAIAADTGRRPKTLQVQVLRGSDKERILTTLREIIRPIRCGKTEQLWRNGSPRQWEGFNQRLAGGLTPNDVPQLTVVHDTGLASRSLGPLTAGNQLWSQAVSQSLRECEWSVT